MNICFHKYFFIFVLTIQITSERDAALVKVRSLEVKIVEIRRQLNEVSKYQSWPLTAVFYGFKIYYFRRLKPWKAKR